MFWSTPAHSSGDDRSIQSITVSPDATFDKDTTNFAYADSGVFIRVNLSGSAAPVDENPDNQGGVRMEIYNSNGDIVRRLVAQETSSTVLAPTWWNGQGDTVRNDTVAYGSYTLRAYCSLRNPTLGSPLATISSSGAYIDRPGDMHVSADGTLTWINAGSQPGFCQVALNDPNTQNSTFIRRQVFGSDRGAANTDQAYGLTVNSKGEIFVSDNNCTGVAQTRISKYNPTTETWIVSSGNWYDSTANIDEIYGLGIDMTAGPFFDSVYAATATALDGGGAGGLVEAILMFRDNGATGQVFRTTADLNSDMFDVAPGETSIAGGESRVYAVDRAGSHVDTFTQFLQQKRNNFKGIDSSATLIGRGVWAYNNAYFWVTDNKTDSFSKYDVAGNRLYTVAGNSHIDGAAGICVWYKASTNETFVIVGGQSSNEIVIFKENAAGNSATYLRNVLEDDYYLSDPIGIAVASDSALVVVSRATRTVKKYDKDGNFMPLVGAANGRFIQGYDTTTTLTDTTGFQYPGAIAIDSAGRIYVFDQDSTTGTTSGNGRSCIKRFSPDGTPDPKIWVDIQAAAKGSFIGEIPMAIYSNGNIYAVSRNNNSRLMRFGPQLVGTTQDSTLCGATANFGGTPVTISRDILAIAGGPCFDSNTQANPKFFPDALYVLTDQTRVRAYQSDLQNQICGAEIIPAAPALAAASLVTQPFLVDYFGEHYYMIDGGGASYTFSQYNGSDTTNRYDVFGTMGYTINQGSGATNLNGPRQMVWVDNKGVFKLNAASGRYEQKIWVNDKGNNRLKQMLVEWNSVATTPITVAQTADTPLVVSATLTETGGVTQIGGTYYVPVGTCTIAVNFNHTCVVGAPDTVTVQFKPTGGSFTNVNKLSWDGLAYKCTVAITSGMSDGNVELKVSDAYDNSGSVNFISPNPNQTDFDVTDNFKPFVIDKTAPVISVSAPPAAGDTTSNSTYTVSGNVTTEATGLDATIQVINWTASSGGTQIDSQSTTAGVTDGAFSRSVTLLSPAPSANYIEVVATDKVGNTFTLSPRRLVTRQKPLGSAYVEPFSETVVASPRLYTLTYTASGTLSGDSIQFTVPAAWSAPQKTSPTSAGYVTMAYPPSVYTDSKFSGQTVTILGVTRSTGQTISLVYGDSTSGQTALAKSTVNAALDDASNTFTTGLEQVGDTVFTGVSAAASRTLTAPLRDSALSIALRDTGPGGNNVLTDSVTIAKGNDTKVLTVRFYNTNAGAHSNRVTQVQLIVESDTGDAVKWSNTASEVVAKNTSEGLTFADVTTFPVSQTLTITPTNFTIDQGQSRDMEFWVTFSSTATPDTVRFYFASAVAFSAVDSASGKTLTVLEQETKVAALRTGEFDIIGLVPADTLLVAADTSVSASPFEVATGQTEIALMDIKLKNDPQGSNAVNSIRVDRIALSLRDSAANSDSPFHALKGIHLRDATSGTTYGGVDSPSTLLQNRDTIPIDLSGLSISSGQTATVRVFVDIVNDTSVVASMSKFRMRLFNSGSPLETTAITAADKTLNIAIKQIHDDASLADSPPFQTDTISIIKRAKGSLMSVTIFRTDSTILNGGSIAAGANFLVALRYQDTSGGGSLNVTPSDTDLKFTIAGVDKTSEFTVAKPANKTISQGSEDTLTYSVVQNLGSSSGLLVVAIADTGQTSGDADTRPRLWDAHSATLRADMTAPYQTANFTLTTQTMVIAAFRLDTTFASPGETAVSILGCTIANQSGGIRGLDSLVVTIVSPDSAVKIVRLYHDNHNTTLNPSDSTQPIAGLDTLVASGTLNASDSSCTFVLSPLVMIASGGTETFFIAVDAERTQTDGDTFDALIPVNGVRCSQEVSFPTASVNSSGTGFVEVVATRVTVTPDTQIVASSSSPNFTMKAVDAFGNLDNVINYESSVQGYNVQVQVTVSDATPATDTNFSITATSGMTGVTPTPAATGISSINGNLASGQGQVTVRDTSAETVAIAIASVFIDSSAAIQYANLITASAVNLTYSDSAAADTRAFTVAKFRVTNQSGAADQVTSVGVHSLNTNDANVTAVILFRDDNGNGEIDSGTDLTVGTGHFSGGEVSWNFLTINVPDQDSKLFMIGYNVATSVADGNTLDCRVDTVVVNSSGANIASQLNSTPNRAIDVKAIRISLTPQTTTSSTGLNLTVTAKAVDTNGNVDIHYTGGSTKCQFTLTGSPTFVAASTTLTNQTYPDGSNQKIRGNLVQGQADLVFTDNSAETPGLSVTVSPNLPVSPAANDTGSYVFQQGFLATVLTADQKSVNRGDTNVVLLAFNVSAAGVSDTITGITVTWTGTDTRDIGNVRLFKDQNADDTFSASADTVYGGPQSFVGFTCTFVTIVPADSVRVNSGNNKSFFVVADIADTATGPDTLDAALLVGGVTTQTGISNVPSATRNSTGNDTVLRAPDTLSVGSVSTSSRQASEQQTEIIPMTLRFSSPGVADRKFYVETVAIEVEGLSGGKTPSSVIKEIKLRNQFSGVVYADTTGIPASGDSIVLKIPFDTANPMTMGGATPETITVEVVVTIADSVTHNDTFRLRVNGIDTPSVRAFDHPTSTVSRFDQKNNVTLLNGATLPILGAVVTVQKQALVTQTAIRITDMSGVDITYPSTLTQGNQFQVLLGLSAASGRADAQVKSADTDLTFKRSNGAVDITSEFTILSRDHSSLTDLAAGTQDTIAYTCVQVSPFSGTAETLVINNYLQSDTGPFIQDKNSASDATKLRVYAVENATSTGAVRLDSTYASIGTVSLSANDIAPDSKGTRILQIRITDGGPRDTVTGVRLHLTTHTAATMIKSCWIAVDTNHNAVYDSGTDPIFGSVQDFKASDTAYFIGTGVLSGGGADSDLFVLINLETSPVTDSTQIQVEVPIDGLGFQGQDSSPKTTLSVTTLFRTIIVATLLQAAPNAQSLSAGATAVLTIRAEDTYGNLNTRTTNYATVTTNCLINDTWTPDIKRSARWTSTNFTSQSPSSLPSASYYDTLVTGKLVSGAATVNMTDTEAETLAVRFTATGLVGETVLVGFTTDPTVTAVALSNLMKISPDSTDAVILQFDVAYPSTASTVDSLYLVSENTFDTAMKRLRLWIDSDANSSFSTTGDSAIDTAVWSNGRCSFLVGGRNFVKAATINSVRFFVTAQMETSPQNDNDSLGCRIDTNGIRLTPGGNFPSSGEIDAIVPDTQNAVIDIDALQTGGSARFVDPGAQSNGTAFTITVRAEDKYGNLDRVFTTLGSSASKNVTLSASPSGFTFNSTSMTTVSGWPGTSPIARFKNGSDTINITPNQSGTITLSTAISSTPPADTSIAITVNAVVSGTIVADSYALTSDTFSSGASNVVIASFYVQNSKATNDSVQTITLKNNGTHPDTGLTNVRIMIDGNGNGVFDGVGVDTPFGASGGSFVSGSLSRTDSALVATGATTRFLVVCNLSPTLTVDSLTLRARVDTGGITMFSGDTACTRPLISNGVTRTGVIFDPSVANALDSVIIAGGTGIADNIDTVTISVSIRDTNGVPATSRTVWLRGDTGSPVTVLSSNPQTTPQNGEVNFVVKASAANTYNFQCSVNGVNATSSATAVFISVNLSSGSNLGGNPVNNVQQTIVTGSTKTYIGNLSFGGSANPNTMCYIRGDGTNWQLVKQNVGGAPTALLSMNAAPGSETGQVSFAASTKIASTKTSLFPGGAEQALVGIIYRATGRRTQIHAVNLTTGESTRITPNDPFDPNNGPMIDNGFRFFDMHPSGDTVMTILDGNLLSWSKADAAVWDNTVDSAKIRYITAMNNGWGMSGSPTNSEIYFAYPAWSPDGKRLAVSLVYVSDTFPVGPVVNRADIYVIKNIDAITYGVFPDNPFIATLQDTSQSNFVRVVANDSFAFFPRWTRTGDGIVYSVARGPVFDWQRVFLGYPNDSSTFDSSNFVTRFIYYDKAAETAPYAPIDISTESAAGSGSMDIVMSQSGQQQFAYVRKSRSGASQVYEVRSVSLDTETIVTSQGGVLFDSGRIVVVVPSSESYGLGFKIGGTPPETTPTNLDSIIITGAGKTFFAPGNESKPFYFADSITIFIYYGKEDFTDTELQGFDSDGDGIPDRTEAALSVYYYNGTKWEDYKAVRYPAENKLEFKTMHFSRYSAGLPMEARALAFAGSVASVIAYPNPWRSDGPTAGLAATNEAYGIKLTRIPGPDVRVRIYTLSGELLVDGTVNAANGTSTNPALRVTAAIVNDGDALGTISWNLKNQSGRDIASGVYLIVLEGPGGRSVRKVAVIR